MSVKARISVDGGLNFFETHGEERIVVKLRVDESITQEVSIYIQEDGRVDCRYFTEDETGKFIFSGMMHQDGFELGTANAPEVFNDR